MPLSVAVRYVDRLAGTNNRSQPGIAV